MKNNKILMGVAASTALIVGANTVTALLRGTSLPGKLVLVTGASSGIGAATSVALAKAGAHVVLVARSQGKLEEVAARVKEAGGTATVLVVDSGDCDKVEAAANTLVKDVGLPDVLVNCAGAGRWRFLDEMDAAEIKLCMDAPYFCAAFWARALVRQMVERGSGSIINVQSPASLQPFAGATAYCTGRWALRGLSEALACDTFGTGVIVQEVVCGEVTDSAYFEGDPESKRRFPLINVLLKPSITSEGAAGAIVSAIKGGRRHYCYPFMLSVASGLLSHMPVVVRFLTQIGSMASLKGKPYVG